MKIFNLNLKYLKQTARLMYRLYIHEMGKQDIEKQIKKIFQDVLQGRNKKLFYYTKKFENHILTRETVRVSMSELDSAWRQVPAEDRKLIKLAAGRIERFHHRQRPCAFKIIEKTGSILEQRIVPLNRIGICVPGGRAPLFSTVLMAAIPATIAGVEEIAMISPWPNGEMNPYILTAAQLVGIKEIYKIGGAQGVAALCHGTETIPSVEKIVGPGNIWVSKAKVFAASLGKVAIDTIAGPSEIVVLADGSCPAEWVAADMLSQLEHGEDSRAILVVLKKGYAQKVSIQMKRLCQSSGHKAYLKAAMDKSATAIICGNIETAIGMINWLLSPEHLEIVMKDPRKILPKIKNAASVFLGSYSPVPVGDYLAGPNHILPTNQAARFSSPLGVEDFVKRQSVVEFSKEALLKLGPVAERMAELEGLDGHAAAIRIRREAIAKEKPRKKRGRK